MDKKPLIEKLRSTVKQAEIELQEKGRLELLKVIEEEEKTIAEEAKKTCDELLGEEKLLALAQQRISICPILFISDRRPVKNKKTGYRNNIGKEGRIFYEEIASRGFTPTIVRICFDSEIGEKGHFDKRVVDKLGYYLGIDWV